MKVEIIGNVCKVTRETGDKKIYSESLLLYKVKNELIKQGYDVIKKLVQKDGHLYGDKYLHYIRTRNWKAKDFMMIYDNEYALRFSYEDYNKEGEKEFNIERGN